MTVAGVAACLRPTQVTVVISTDLPCQQYRGIALTVGRLGADLEGRVPSVTSTSCDAQGHIGSVVVVPSEGDSDEIAVRVVAGNARDPELCVAPGYGPQCIVARRALRYIPHTPLTVPIVMRVSCDGIACSPNETCVFGLCRSAVIPRPEDCEGDGCGEQVLVPGTTPPPDAGVDGSALDGSALPDAPPPPPPPPDASGGGGACDTVGGFEPGASWPSFGGCGSHAGRTTVIGPPAGAQVKWFVAVGAAGSPGTSAVVAANGILYVGGDSLRAVSPAGTVLWTVPGTVSQTPAIGRGAVYAVTSISLNAHALDGGLLWSAAVGGVAGPNLGVDGTIYISGTASRVGAYHPDGGGRWNVDGGMGGPPVLAAPAVGADGTIYGAPVGSGSAQAYLPANGAVKWSASASSPFQSSPVAGANGMSFFPAGFTVVAALPDGGVAWTFSSPPTGDGGVAMATSPAVGADGTVYIAGGNDGTLHARDPLTGVEKWSVVVGGSLGPPIIDGEGTIYLGSSTGHLVGVRQDRSEKLRLAIGVGLRSPLTLGPDGRLYVVADDGKLYAVGP